MFMWLTTSPWIALTRVLTTTESTATNHFLWCMLLHLLTWKIGENLNVNTEINYNVFRGSKTYVQKYIFLKVFKAGLKV